MITFITGLPGNGKTLYAINYIKAYSEKENREVYYSGIKDLTLPWTEIKAEEWMTLPPGAIIVIDEAQFTFPKKPNGSKLPEHYEKLAVHRHSGYDIFIITQHPTLVDNFVRQLCGRHLHVIRKFGMQRAKVWEWASANTSPEKPASHKSAILHKFSYPKEVYGYYKSAEVHTVKRSIPMKLVLACLFVLAVPAFGYYVLDRFQSRAKPQNDAASSGVVTGAVPGAAPATNASYLDPVTDARRYVFMNTPRVSGLPHTAPKYDEMTRPTSVPVPAACVRSASRCKCYSQQGTPLDVPLAMCIQFSQNGFFQDFQTEQQQGDIRQVEMQQSAPVTQQSASAVQERRSVSADGYGVLGKVGPGVRMPGQS